MKDIVNVFIFRRDLRIIDNMALDALHASYPDMKILPVFIFNPRQIDKGENAYFSSAGVEFMIESLNDLNAYTKNSMAFYYGDDIEILEKLMRNVIMNSIAFNTDFTPFARQRDKRIIDWCAQKNIQVLTRPDYVLFNFDIKTDAGTTYEVFTPFYKKCMAHITGIQKPNKEFKGRFYHPGKLPNRIKSVSRFIDTITPQRVLHGGRQEALLVLEKIRAKMYIKYDSERDYPSMDKTTKMSPYLKYGCISIREALWECMKAYGASHGLVRELLWREFYANITHAMPSIIGGQLKGGVYMENHAMKKKYDSVAWKANMELYAKWCEGKTGFPIIDAAMICMNKTGFMHNRLRMVVAMFLTKDMMLDWRLGERYFATKLVDYDPSSNNGGWQWSASTGADAQPYFRVFNPWTQSEKFDKECMFIKKWIPALAHVPNKSIHAWHKEFNFFNVQYPPPILDHWIESKKIINYFAEL